MSVPKKNSPGMDLAGAACGSAALLYLVCKLILNQLANLLLAAQVPGASLANPAGIDLTSATLLRMLTSALALAAPFLLLLWIPLNNRLPLQKGRREYGGRLLLLFWASMLVGNILASQIAASECSAPSLSALPVSGLPLILAWAAACLLPAVGEELLFRGLMQGWLRPYGFWAAVLGQAVLFSLLHGRLSVCVPALFGGVVLGLCAELSGSLRMGMLFHLYNNSAAFLDQYAGQYWQHPTKIWLELSLLFLPALLAAVLRKSSRPRRILPQSQPFPVWLLRCPGWLTPAAMLLVLSITQSYFK